MTMHNMYVVSGRQQDITWTDFDSLGYLALHENNFTAIPHQ